MASREYMGWLGGGASTAAWKSDSLRSVFSDFFIAGQTRSTQRVRFAPWDKVIKIASGKEFLPSYSQKTSDCVSFGVKNAIEHLSCIVIAVRGDNGGFRPIFSPYYHGIGRLMPEGGGGHLSCPGSLGSWQAAAILKSGTIFSDMQDCPSYSGELADNWGNQMSSVQPWVERADTSCVKAIARLRTGDQVRDALVNGYPCTIASIRGYSMKLKDDRGKSWWQGHDTWSHQKCLVAYDYDPVPCVLDMHSWGANAHEPQLDGPSCSAWSTLDHIDKLVRKESTECIAYSNFDGFPEQRLDWSS